jgi:hypothetical protein
MSADAIPPPPLPPRPAAKMDLGMQPSVLSDKCGRISMRQPGFLKVSYCNEVARHIRSFELKYALDNNTKATHARLMKEIQATVDGVKKKRMDDNFSGGLILHYGMTHEALLREIHAMYAALRKVLYGDYFMRIQQFENAYVFLCTKIEWTSQPPPLESISE